MADERAARMGLAAVAEPGDPALVAVLARFSASEVWAKVRAGHGAASWVGRAAAFDERTVRLLMERRGMRFVIPGDEEWPPWLLDLDRLEPVQGMKGAPVGLWLLGPGSLVRDAARSVAIVGSRASTPYGERVSAELGAGLAAAGWTVLSGGAYGVDAAAHRGALAENGATISVQAGGLAELYPKGNTALLERIADVGLLVSEVPPAEHPTRRRFLARNRLIAALAKGTVIVEAAARSGAKNTASWATACLRPLMAVPGPVSSATSYGPHRLIREGEATLVAGAADVLECVAPVGCELAPEPECPERLLDGLTGAQRAVYEALPGRGGRSAGEIAVRAGGPMPATLSALATLEAAGLARRRSDGTWGLGERQDRLVLATPRGATAGDAGETLPGLR